ncbi:MAG: ribosome biogenesis factor YjgA [Pseudomonadales bacterium]
MARAKKTDIDTDDLPSRSQLKREQQALHAMGKRLVELKPGQLTKLPLWPDLSEAVTLAQRLKNNEGKRRQLNYISRLLREGDNTTITEALKDLDKGDLANNLRFHALELMRDQLLIAGPDGVETIIEKYPQADRSLLRQLVRVAAKEEKENKPPKSARKIFKYLREQDESAQ